MNAVHALQSGSSTQPLRNSDHLGLNWQSVRLHTRGTYRQNSDQIAHSRYTRCTWTAQQGRAGSVLAGPVAWCCSEVAGASNGKLCGTGLVRATRLDAITRVTRLHIRVCGRSRTYSVSRTTCTRSWAPNGFLSLRLLCKLTVGMKQDCREDNPGNQNARDHGYLGTRVVCGLLVPAQQILSYKSWQAAACASVSRR